ncbi:hypothetical protein FL966_08785 [Caproiciproducens galactitolivorans]|uniref:Uncharacterized protein n=1 Tax=Caproiciproducens galactitolivorans TaxID=642589 RepID=A0A4Z0Y1F1_9FIRM|nr:hypothetical protein [Caproiciproducens galactitolivorans]QEY35126.1 hypothetical protein FL966_08785 [Caproiciproducens galactitolivorans]TGJ76647.1 hypothetical protein CAGA_11890 [Caproiciproducens galactitolivorans]
MADSYNYDMQRLQQDAIRRAREMQSRAQAAVSQSNRNIPNPPGANQARNNAPSSQRSAAAPTASPAEKPTPQHSNNTGGQMVPFRNLFDTLFDDSERTLILVLMLLLIEERADTGLIFALLYLVL